ncbi:MAG: glutathione S-transferase N-terminal domain-containing protein [Polyangiaceae bacterium]
MRKFYHVCEGQRSGEAKPPGSWRAMLCAGRVGPMTELLGLPYSPWTEKARFALDVRGVPYRFRNYSPLLGEPELRLRLRRLRGPVSVPVLVDDSGRSRADSLEIARWADARGRGPCLFPDEHARAVEGAVALSERGLAAGRALSLLRMLDDEEALREMLPKPLRRSSLRAFVGLARAGVERTRQKYGGDRRTESEHRDDFDRALGELRARLSEAPDGAPRTLTGNLSFADIALAQLLVFVAPPRLGLRLGRASRRCFEDPGLAERYADLVTWRDALYAAHRSSSPGKGLP